MFNIDLVVLGHREASRIDSVMPSGSLICNLSFQLNPLAQVVLKAVRSNAHALEHAGTRLRRDREAIRSSQGR